MAAEESLSGQQFDEKTYKHHYNRGWAAGANEGGLDRADARREPNEWYDGYMDSATSRPKWSYLHARKAGKSIEEWEGQ